ncbi:3-dehydroquinate synthase [Sutcliffiella horikoshii]|uniref:3-dehydroquinate synthase n=1 Tax=Sutcliffiella horikoshii TaxID=79883 RepID=A0ABM6KKD6_9BACI|nr:3-dehydroquinate synthase [Sutcliffiella horikoshii]ART76867.1 3-dehydroquinate synthase [Sutcliffiella horikoshii]
MPQNFNSKQVVVQTDSKEYPVFLGKGVIEQLPRLLGSFEKKPSKVLIVTDDLVADLYLSEIVLSLTQRFTVHSYVLPNGEEAKSFENYYAIQTFALENGLDRHSAIIALGGGVVGDIAGFVASTFMRGIKFIQVPTTLLAHDSAVGGKVAINHPLGKNMIGSFYQPEAVIYDVDFLKSLPDSEMRSGFAEVVKHSLIWDEAFYHWIKENIKSLADLTEERLLVCLENGIKIKAEVVSNDEKETGLRAILNFGHTLGHALEAAYGYGKITHGDGVALGMLFATRLSEKLNANLNLTADLIESWNRYGFPTKIRSSVSPEELLGWMKKDKKTQNSHIHMVLIQSVGNVELRTVSDELILETLQEFY